MPGAHSGQQLALLIRTDEAIYLALAFEPDGAGLITTIRVIANPDKLTYLN